MSVRLEGASARTAGFGAIEITRCREQVAIVVEAGSELLEATLVLCLLPSGERLLARPIVLGPGRRVQVAYRLDEALLASGGVLEAALEIADEPIATTTRAFGGERVTGRVERVEKGLASGLIARDAGPLDSPLLVLECDGERVELGTPTLVPGRGRSVSEASAAHFHIALPPRLFDGVPHHVRLLADEEPLDGFGPVFEDTMVVMVREDGEGRTILSCEEAGGVSLVLDGASERRLTIADRGHPVLFSTRRAPVRVAFEWAGDVSYLAPQAALVPVLERIEAVERAARLLAEDPRLEAQERRVLCEVQLPAVVASLRSTMTRGRRGADADAFAEQMRARPSPVASPRAGVSVVVPVYGGRDETMACLTALARSDLPAETHVLVVDDASPDPVLSGLVEAACARWGFEHRRNPVNLGFVGTVNHVLGRLRNGDVVLLNADAIVPRLWLQRLRTAASSQPRVGTVTPFSNAGTFVSYPRSDVEGEIDGSSHVEDLDRLFASANTETVVEAPSGVGFCLYMTRAAIDAVGLLDPLFAPGYGEENDWCLRASSMGFVHLVACDTFVGHIGGISFGTRKKDLVEAHRPRLVERYPDYPHRVRRFLRSDPLAPARRRVDLARLAEAPPFALLVLGEGSDAQAAAVADAALERKAGRPAAVLRRAGLDDVDPWYEIECVAPDALIRFRLSEAGDVLEELGRAGLERIVVHGFLGLDLSLLEPLYASRARLELVAHDHALVCPRTTCVRSDGRYCGGPEPATCETCLAVDGPDPRLLGFDALVASAAEWRALGADLAAQADRVCATSEVAAERLTRLLGVAVAVAAVSSHGEPPRAEVAPPFRRILVGESLAEPRHAALVRALARDAAARGRDLVFVVHAPAGTASAEWSHPRIERHDDLLWPPARAVETLRVDAGLVLDPGPTASPRLLRTFWKAGLPVVARGEGAPAALVRELGGGIALDAQAGIAEIVDVLAGIAAVTATGDAAKSRAKVPRRRASSRAPKQVAGGEA